MRNPICISTGCLYNVIDDMNDRIEELSKFSPMGIELLFSHLNHLLSFNISKKNLEYLKDLKFNSIHAPWKEITYGENKTTKEAFKKISFLYKQIKAGNVVFHTSHIKDYSLILNSNFVSSIENSDWRNPGHNIEDIKSILDKYEKLKFTFDFAHAITVSATDIPNYISQFKDRLAEIHISMYDKVSQEHSFLHEYNSKEIKGLLQYLKNTSVPLILECFIPGPEEIKLIKKEIEYLEKI